MRYLIIIGLLLTLSACKMGYSFTGVDTGNAQTFSVDFFPNNADLVQPQLSQIFTDALRDIFIQQTSLSMVERGADLHFEGSIIGYKIEPINVQAGEISTVAQNRMTVVVNVIFTNNLEPKNSFEQRFSRFTDFDAEADLNQVETELLDLICTELSENILNNAIGNW